MCNIFDSLSYLIKLENSITSMCNTPRQKEEYHFLLDNKGNALQGGPFSNTDDEFSYSNRFVCLFDILGCSDTVRKSLICKDEYDRVKLFASTFRETEQMYTNQHWAKDFTFPITHGGFTKDYNLSEENIKVNLSLFSDNIYFGDSKPKNGEAGGNGLEHISRAKFGKVYSMDINPAYLKEAVLT